jgi:hypothetical protein
MKYLEVRDQIRSGDIFAWRGTNFLANIIEHVTGGSYSHVAVAWRFRKRLFLLQANEGTGVQLIAASTTVKRGPCDWISTDVNWTDKVEDVALSQLGLPYNYIAAAEVGFNLIPSTSAEICSIYAGNVLNACGMKINYKGLTPKSLVDNLLNNGAVLRQIS